MVWFTFHLALKNQIYYYNLKIEIFNNSAIIAIQFDDLFTGWKVWGYVYLKDFTVAKNLFNDMDHKHMMAI